MGQESPKLYWKFAQKSEKMTHLAVKNWIFKKNQKSSIIYGTGFSHPKYPLPRWKNVTSSLKQKKILVLYKDKIEKCL